MRVIASVITILGTAAAVLGSIWGAWHMNHRAWGAGVQDARPETPTRKFWRYLLNAVAAIIVIFLTVLIIGVAIKVTIQLFDL